MPTVRQRYRQTDRQTDDLRWQYRVLHYMHGAVIIYESVLRPLLVYGCEAWTLTSATKIMVRAAEMRVLRLIKGVIRRHMLRNEDIRKELGVQSILQYVEQSQLCWYGRVKRMTDGGIAQHWLQWTRRTTRPRGRPWKRWMDNIKEAVQIRATTVQDIRACGVVPRQTRIARLLH